MVGIIAVNLFELTGVCAHAKGIATWLDWASLVTPVGGCNANKLCTSSPAGDLAKAAASDLGPCSCTPVQTQCNTQDVMSCEKDAYMQHVRQEYVEMHGFGLPRMWGQMQASFCVS